jgi:hypothetical protein
LPTKFDARQSGKCQVCRSPDVYRIELLKAGGASAKALAAKFNVSVDAVTRHWAKHVTDAAKRVGILGGTSDQI